MNLISILVLSLILAGCDMFGSSSSGTASNAVAVPPAAHGSNITKDADGLAQYQLIEASLSAVPIPTLIDVGRTGAVVGARCIIVWETALGYSAGCFDRANGDLFVPNCSGSPLACPRGGQTLTAAFYEALGPARALTAQETALLDALVAATYCTAPRLDGSGNPCV